MDNWIASLFVTFLTFHFMYAKSQDEAAARQWLEQYDRGAADADYNRGVAYWEYYTNITDYNQKLMTDAQVTRARFILEAYHNASNFDWQNMSNKTLRRQFKFITDIYTAILSEEEVTKVESLRSGMTKIYSTANVCDSTGRCLALEPDIVRKFTNSRDWDELLWLWQGWRDNSGKLMKNDYEEFVSLLNKAARANGYKDQGDSWRSRYEVADLAALCERLWQQMSPLYKHLHAYVKRKLKEQYSANKEDFPKSGHIPGHILGNMWGQSWANVFDIVVPFKNKTLIDVTRAMQEQNYNVTDIFTLSEDFFVSLGLDPMPESFWEKSMLEKPTDREVVCHASAWNFFKYGDVRIKMCTDITQKSLFTVHHEMGHVQYYLMYKDQPVIFQMGANSAFHEALGDAMTLSVRTPKHLKGIGLLDPTAETDHEADLNFLMQQALESIAFLPFGYLIDQWRWSVFSGETPKDSYNEKWWQLRCKYQGVSPPVGRSEADFDPGAKFHIPSNTPYIRYFLSYVLQFQFQRSLCNISGHEGPLHHCDVYGSKAAGSRLRRMLELGQSVPWPDALEILTGQRDFDASAIIEYFQPLMQWLEIQNQGENLDWDEKCPEGSFTSSSVPLTWSTLLIVLVLIRYWL